MHAAEPSNAEHRLSPSPPPTRPRRTGRSREELRLVRVERGVIRLEIGTQVTALSAPQARTLAAVLVTEARRLAADLRRAAAEVEDGGARDEGRGTSGGASIEG
jgi:hypothetical protein